MAAADQDETFVMPVERGDQTWHIGGERLWSEVDNSTRRADNRGQPWMNGTKCDSRTLYDPAVQAHTSPS